MELHRAHEGVFKSGRNSSPHRSHGPRSRVRVAGPIQAGLSASTRPHCRAGPPHIFMVSFPSGSLRQGRGFESADVGLLLFSLRHGPSEEPALRRSRYLGFRRSQRTRANFCTVASPIQLVSTPLRRFSEAGAVFRCPVRHYLMQESGWVPFIAPERRARRASSSAAGHAPPPL
ncbi:hypothetical protein NDU88_001111 [Pleurodeles waltl]|uniref:Uncharacterized protein n=1 Tax=Pleurodeles waltl TaxID=8319 RepID=A0AAV7LAC4_PLEWA|nr:hypothetical protein NDU88_001111 [Pleurodeles waltl]